MMTIETATSRGSVLYRGDRRAQTTNRCPRTQVCAVSGSVRRRSAPKRSLVIAITLAVATAAALIVVDTHPSHATSPARPLRNSVVRPSTTTTTQAVATTASTETVTATESLSPSQPGVPSGFMGATVAASPVVDPPKTLTMVVDGTAGRTAVVHLPALTAGSTIPVVLALHGSNSSGTELETITGLDMVADDNGFIAVYPDGALIGGNRSWNSGGCCSPATDGNVDDVAFINTLIDQLLTLFPIDATRVYVAGHSNGAIMAQLIGCRLSGRVAAIASVSGALDPATPCRPAQPVSMIEVHGTEDGNVDYVYGQQAVASWRHQDHCNDTAVITSILAACTSSWSCSDDSSVALVTIFGGGHAWSAGAGQAIWAFLAEHTRTDLGVPGSDG